MEEMNSNDFDIPISQNYILKANNKLGSGSFGDIYLGKNTKTNEKIAIKLELKNIPNSKLKLESKIYSIIEGGIGIPIIYYIGKEGKYNIMIMELLGDNLEKIFNKNNRKFSLKTICEISKQTISRLEYIHSKKIIHRDIKPENFLIGINNNKNTLYLIDYGLSKKYKNKNGFHIPYIDGKKLIGTIRYISVNTHLGIEQSRRDDLESLIYVIIYLLKGNLPWIGLKVKNKNEKIEKIMNKKIYSKLDEICDGLPKEFAIFLQYTRDIGFDQTPNYSFLRKIIENVCKKNNIVLDNELHFDESNFDNKDMNKLIVNIKNVDNNESEDKKKININEENKLINNKENISED